MSLIKMVATRRGFIFGLTGAFCAPAVVRASSLMPISSLAPSAVIDPRRVGRVLSETSRIRAPTKLRPAPRGSFDTLSHEVVIDIGNGYEAGYTRTHPDQTWALGFLDDARDDWYGQVGQQYPRPKQGNSWLAAAEKAAREMALQRDVVAASAALLGVPTGLVRDNSRKRKRNYPELTISNPNHNRNTENLNG